MAILHHTRKISVLYHKETLQAQKHRPTYIHYAFLTSQRSILNTYSYIQAQNVHEVWYRSLVQKTPGFIITNLG